MQTSNETPKGLFNNLPSVLLGNAISLRDLPSTEVVTSMAASKCGETDGSIPSYGTTSTTTTSTGGTTLLTGTSQAYTIQAASKFDGSSDQQQKCIHQDMEYLYEHVAPSREFRGFNRETSSVCYLAVRTLLCDALRMYGKLDSSSSAIEELIARSRHDLGSIRGNTTTLWEDIKQLEAGVCQVYETALSQKAQIESFESATRNISGLENIFASYDKRIVTLDELVERIQGELQLVQVSTVDFKAKDRIDTMLRECQEKVTTQITVLEKTLREVSDLKASKNQVSSIVDQQVHESVKGIKESIDLFYHLWDINKASVLEATSLASSTNLTTRDGLILNCPAFQDLLSKFSEAQTSVYCVGPVQHNVPNGYANISLASAELATSVSQSFGKQGLISSMSSLNLSSRLPSSNGMQPFVRISSTLSVMNEKVSTQITSSTETIKTSQQSVTILNSSTGNLASVNLESIGITGTEACNAQVNSHQEHTQQQSDNVVTSEINTVATSETTSIAIFSEVPARVIGSTATKNCEDGLSCSLVTSEGNTDSESISNIRAGNKNVNSTSKVSSSSGMLNSLAVPKARASFYGVDESNIHTYSTVQTTQTKSQNVSQNTSTSQQGHASDAVSITNAANMSNVGGLSSSFMSSRKPSGAPKLRTNFYGTGDAVPTTTVTVSHHVTSSGSHTQQAVNTTGYNNFAEFLSTLNGNESGMDGSWISPSFEAHVQELQANITAVSNTQQEHATFSSAIAGFPERRGGLSARNVRATRPVPTLVPTVNPVARGCVATSGRVINVDLGISVNAHEMGVIVKNVDPNSIAAKSGLRVGDILCAVDGEVVRDAPDLLHALHASICKAHEEHNSVASLIFTRLCSMQISEPATQVIVYVRL